MADTNLFNSEYNKTTFLANLNSFLKQTPDYCVKINIQADLDPKCSVVYFPINICQSVIDSALIETTLEQMLTHLNYENYISKL